MRVIGFAGWSGAGKTTLLRAVIPCLQAAGLSVSTIKQAHHGFDLDTPGKDSWLHREAGARQVLVTSPRRWALLTELRGAPALTLPELLAHLAPVDLVLVEGFKREAHPQIEVYREANGKPRLGTETPRIVAVASDVALPGEAVPVLRLDDAAAVAAFAAGAAQPPDAIGWSHFRHTERGP